MSAITCDYGDSLARPAGVCSLENVTGSHEAPSLARVQRRPTRSPTPFLSPAKRNEG
jgi:hypothetical protein